MIIIIVRKRRLNLWASSGERDADECKQKEVCVYFCLVVWDWEVFLHATSIFTRT